MKKTLHGHSTKFFHYLNYRMPIKDATTDVIIRRDKSDKSDISSAIRCNKINPATFTPHTPIAFHQTATRFWIVAVDKRGNPYGVRFIRHSDDIRLFDSAKHRIEDREIRFLAPTGSKKLGSHHGVN